MYALNFITESGIKVLSVARTKRETLRPLEEYEGVDTAEHWRLHDSTGWCDGSPNAWEHFQYPDMQQFDHTIISFN